MNAFKTNKFSLISPRLGLLLTVLIFLALTLPAAYRETPTVDEFAHLPAGLSYWHSGFDLYSKNPPLIKLWMSAPLEAANAASRSLTGVARYNVPSVTVDSLGWGPWLYGTKFEAANADEHYFEAFFLARVCNLLLAIASAVVLFWWARDSTNDWIASLVASGLLLSPTVLAHSHLATVDIGCLFTILLACFYLSRTRSHWSFSNFLTQSAAAGLLVGVALAAKFTAAFLIPWLFTAVLYSAFSNRSRLAPKIVLGLSLSLFTLLFSVNIIYGFNIDFRPINSYRFESRSVSKLIGVIPSEFASLPIPLPEAFMKGFDAQAKDAETGEFGSYLLGRWSASGWWYYNLLAFGFKETLVTVFLLLGSILLLTNRWLKKGASFESLRAPLSSIWSILIPLILIGVPLSLASRLQIGVRYLLPIYPFLFLILALGLNEIYLMARAHWVRLCIVSGVAIYVCWLVPAFFAAGDSLCYFNSVALLFGQPEELLLDSNLDWGQDLYRLRDINEKSSKPIGLLYFGHVNPKDYGISYYVPRGPSEGLIAVSVNFLKGAAYVAPSPDSPFVEVQPGQADWLKNYEPIAKAGSIYIYDIQARH